MSIVVDESIFPPNINAITEIKVVIAIDIESGKQGVASMTQRDPAGFISHTPIVWADCDRDRKMEKMVAEMALQSPRTRLRIKKFRLAEDG